MDTPLYIGIDDTDSPNGGCTTYVCAILIEKLEEMGCVFVDYPHLIRLNPNVPWKTRGNGSVCLPIQCSIKKIPEVKKCVLKIVEKFSTLDNINTDPAVSFIVGKIPEQITHLSYRAIRSIVKIDEAVKIAKSFGIEQHCLKGFRGIVGSIASLGNILKEDYTFELITYRKKENIGNPRRVTFKTVMNMDNKTKPYTFNNIDAEKKRILITPHGADPILYGIRGENPNILKKAAKMLAINEPIERWVIFRTNQGTDMHFSSVTTIIQARPYNATILIGKVIQDPQVIQGGHVFFTLKDETGIIRCAAFEPTGNFKNIVKKLIQGDMLKVYGGVKPATVNNPRTLNLEKLEILSLNPKIILLNPICQKCSKRMKSLGRSQGFKCKKCKYKSSRNKVQKEISRSLDLKLYIPPPRAQRHLTKPELRYTIQNKSFKTKLIKKWHHP